MMTFSISGQACSARGPQGMTVDSATQLITALQKDRLTQSSIVIAAGHRGRRTLNCANILIQPCHTCDYYDDGCSRFPVCRQIVVSLISRHNARFVHDLLRNLGSCRRTVATFIRTRRGFLSFLVRSRAEEDGRHSCFGVPGCFDHRSDVFTIHSWPTSAQLRRCATVVLHGSWIPDNCGCYLPVSPRCATGVLHGSRVSCGGERRPPPARAT